ncbi:D-alanyl-D-alanine carboxypeptidase/D-alanyl-D-alanine-endopeptidase [Sulfitobacter sp. HNIBRBA3233]|uniref:D-alanyl-D-alanine carboxypeptidase/D-alanyl-D-alanine endopeptidase n=1 Tax=Sulfitobacter marinivivus TaxID=3158558 RepID=UPI0032DF58CC
MSTDFSRRRFLAAALSGLVATPALSGPPAASLRPVLRGEDLFKRSVPSVEDILGKARLEGLASFAVADAQTGLRLETFAAQTARPPASVAKVLTALYALDALGQDHRFETRLIATGGIVNGIVQGDLVLAGGGDPTLDTDRLAGMAERLRAAGVTGVKGSFRVYEEALPVLARIDAAQPDQVGYNPGISGLALNYNRVHFEWKRGGNGYDVTMEGRSERYRPAVRVAVMRLEDRAAPVYTYEDRDGRDNWTVARPALGKSGARWLPVRKPGLYAAEVFSVLAGAEGIKLGTPELTASVPAGETVVTERSEALRPLLKDMLKWSTNLTAEMVGMAATQARGVRPDSLKASAEQMNDWARETLGMQSVALVDHSGLGDDSRLTAHDMVTALVRMQGTGLRDILKPIALRDDQRRIVRDHPVTVHAKTGTLNFVSALAGYMTAPDGTEMAFAIFTADEAIRATITREERERPAGGRAWIGRSKTAQQELIERWAVLYGA